MLLGISTTHKQISMGKKSQDLCVRPAKFPLLRIPQRTFLDQTASENTLE